MKYFDDSNFNDLAAIDVIRHEYCHYLVDALGLKELFNDEKAHGIACKGKEVINALFTPKT